MTSPYIAAEAKRLNIGKPKPYERNHYVYARGITDGIKIEPSKPVESWGSGILACIGMVFIVLTAWVVLANIAQYLVRP